jgi:pyruvate dehydrogenase (quinone)
MAKTAADVMVERLIDWGVSVIFGLPGDGINGIMEALRQRQDKIKFIQVRHEEAAAFAACGYAKWTGKLGVCLATSGPGGIHLLNGLYDAKLDGVPVLALTGLQFHDLLATHTQQDVELDKLFIDVSEYNNRIMGPAHVENVVDEACRIALSRRGVSHITFPVDFQSMPMSQGHPSKRNKPHHSSDIYSAGGGQPREQDIVRAAELLNKSSKVALLIGQGARSAGALVIEAAEKLGAPIIKALLGKDVIPDEHPYTTGGIGLLGTAPSEEAIQSCDALLIIGSSFPYIEFYPQPGKAKAVQIDLDPARIGLRYPVDVGIVGDTRRALEMLLPLLERKTNRGFIEEAQSNMRKWNDLMEERASRTDKPMKPQVIAAELGKRLPENAIIACDSGTITTWWARHIPARGTQKYSLSGNLATMACGLPYAIAAAVAYPDRPAFAFIGDGGMSMLMAELATCARYKLNIKIVVIKNNTLGQIKWEQIVFLGNPEYGVDLYPIDFVKAAEAFGIPGFSIDDPADCASTLETALSTPGPVVVEAVVDPNEPPMPGKVKMEQAIHFAEALLRGERDGAAIVKTVLKDRVREMV